MAFCSILFAQPDFASASLFKVVIDPGHGGSDEGTVYQSGHTRIAEKDITLKLSRQVAKQLRAKGYWVTLTRDNDREVSLPARTALANRLKADVFISIHMNSSEKGSSLHWPRFRATEESDGPEGVETFILNHTTDASSKRLARLENSVISDDLSKDTPEQMDVALILKDLRLDGNLTESKRLACNIQRNLVAITGQTLFSKYGNDPNLVLKRDRGVKQALFHVLLGADMPSVLVEPGFLSNSRDRSLALSPQGQFKISHAIAKAIEQFRRRKNRSNHLLSLSRCKIN